MPAASYMLTELLAIDIFKFLLVFARLGGAIMLLPGFAGNLVPVQFRLLLALAITLVVLPVVAATLPAMPANPWAMFLLLFGEITIGIFFAVLVQSLMTALNLAGTFIGFQAGLTNAFIFDPITEQQGALLTGFLSNVAIVLVFATDMHHIMLRVVVESYSLFSPGGMVETGGLLDIFVRNLSRSFLLGIQLAAPVGVFTLVFFAGMGLLSRLMPQMHVFFIALPLQVMMGIGILMVSIPMVMGLFLRFFEDGLARFLAPG